MQELIGSYQHHRSDCSTHMHEIARNSKNGGRNEYVECTPALETCTSLLRKFKAQLLKAARLARCAQQRCPPVAPPSNILHNVQLRQRQKLPVTAACLRPRPHRASIASCHMSCSRTCMTHRFPSKINGHKCLNILRKGLCCCRIDNITSLSSPAAALWLSGTLAARPCHRASRASERPKTSRGTRRRARPLAAAAAATAARI